jgi:hypothetical protein
VAKIHKIAERVDDPGRLIAKDALDVLRLLRVVRTDSLVYGLRGLLDSELARDVTTEALDLAAELMAQADSPAPRMAAQAAGGLEDPDIIAASLATLWSDLSQELDDGTGAR